MESTTQRDNLLADLALLVGIGVVLGLGYNTLGLMDGADWGIAWKGVDHFGEFVETGVTVQAVEDEPEQGYSTVSDDPLAPPALPDRQVPEIPDVGRPVKIELRAVKQLYDAHAALFVDARELWEFDEGHIPGAVSLPAEEAITDPARLEQLDPGGRPIVAYCGGGTCEVSLTLANELVLVGHSRVAVYMGGFPEWVGAGYPVEDAGAQP
jgi:rhodanese-related sulfurtransferase